MKRNAARDVIVGVNVLVVERPAVNGGQLLNLGSLNCNGFDVGGFVALGVGLPEVRGGDRALSLGTALWDSSGAVRRVRTFRPAEPSPRTT